MLSGSKSQTSDHVDPSSQSPNCGIWISKHNLSWVSYPYLPPHATICSTFGSTTVILSFPITETLMLLWLPDTKLFLLLLCNHNVVALMKYSVNVWYARYLICNPQNVENCWSRMFQVLIFDTFHDLWYFIRVQFSRSHPPWLPDWSLGLWMLQGLLTPASHQKAYITLQILTRQQCQPRQFKFTFKHLSYIIKATFKQESSIHCWHLMDFQRKSSGLYAVAMSLTEVTKAQDFIWRH